MENKPCEYITKNIVMQV